MINLSTIDNCSLIFFSTNISQEEVTYILLAAIAADKLKIGRELIMKRSSCSTKSESLRLYKMMI